MKKKIYKTEDVKIQKQIIGKFTVDLFDDKKNRNYPQPDTFTSSGIVTQF
ncbi:hypothetical protein HDF26_002055 [Pedobacter cryoconitis]|uniref:Uncharacterized protein n=1 Tax=Pedobacter cryoconitis TaxID=188932 RepID=A0A7W8ZJI7_9SPHI|nr:hypothetical protein [Pedobacter cryoconitis]MBB5635219.1 hypothetical protein [Pedobacter cryoconitis]MBB6271598.1 hypothetical protein [Pedobacter cryoconitis]